MSQYCYSDAYEVPQHHVDYDNVYTQQHQGDGVGLNRQQIDVASPDSVDHIGYPPDTIGVPTMNYSTGILNDWSSVDTYQSGWLLQEYIGDGGIDTKSTQPHDYSAYPRHHIESGLTSGQRYQPTECFTDPYAQAFPAQVPQPFNEKRDPTYRVSDHAIGKRMTDEIADALQYEPTCPTYKESSSDVPIASSSDRTAKGIFDDTLAATLADQKSPDHDITIDTRRSIASCGTSTVAPTGYGGGFMILGGVAVTLPPRVQNTLIEQLRAILEDLECHSASAVGAAVKLQASPKQQLEFLTNLHKALGTKKSVSGFVGNNGAPIRHYAFRCSSYRCVKITLRMRSTTGLCKPCQKRAKRVRDRALAGF